MTLLERFGAWAVEPVPAGQAERLADHVLDTVGAWLAGSATQDGAALARLQQDPNGILGHAPERPLDRLSRRVGQTRADGNRRYPSAVLHDAGFGGGDDGADGGDGHRPVAGAGLRRGVARRLRGDDLAERPGRGRAGLLPGDLADLLCDAGGRGGGNGAPARPRCRADRRRAGDRPHGQQSRHRRAGRAVAALAGDRRGGPRGMPRRLGRGERLCWGPLPARRRLDRARAWPGDRRARGRFFRRPMAGSRISA